MGDERELDGFGQCHPPFGKGKLINDDKQCFGLMENDGSGQLSAKGGGWE